MIVLSFDRRWVKARLAEREVTHITFARLCGISPWHLSSVLSGRKRPGELTIRKILDGLHRLGEIAAKEVTNGGD